MHGLDHELGTHVLHGLDLHAAVANALDEEGQGLGSGVVLGVGVGTKLNHELEQIPEVDGEERGVVGDEGVEDLEDDLVTLLILGLDGSLEDVNQARNEALHSLEGLGILLGLDDHEDGTNSADDVDADLLALRVLNAGLEELKELVGVVAEVGRVLLEHGVEEERTDLASNDIVVVVEGEKLSEEGKKAANEELVTTGELGEDIGKDKAASLVKGVKERIVREKVTDPKKIRDIIIDVAGDLNINITQQNMNQLADLMEKISHLDLNVGQISGQLQNISKGLDKVGQTINENKGILQQILDAIKGFFAWLARVIRGKTA